jgi:hypothetical protein
MDSSRSQLLGLPLELGRESSQIKLRINIKINIKDKDILDVYFLFDCSELIQGVESCKLMRNSIVLASYC